MHKEEIEISVLPNGRVEYTIKGVKGSACESISQLLSQLGKVEREERTAEFYEKGDNVGIQISQA